jgi:hypothetical protein
MALACIERLSQPTPLGYSRRAEGRLMFETWIDAARFVLAGATGGLIYWAAREHGAAFVELWRRVGQRRN